ncbi:MAG: hypothetical protein ACC669_01900, partial [bacterium]
MDLVEIRKKAKKKKDASRAGKKKTQKKKTSAAAAAAGSSRGSEKEKAASAPAETAVSLKPAAVEEVADKVAAQETDTLKDILLAQTRRPDQEVEEEY